MISLVIPCCGGSPENLIRTIESTRGWTTETLIINTSLFEEDSKWMNELGKVIELPWNYVFLNGFGEMHNAATEHAKNDWLLLLGVAETIAEPEKAVMLGYSAYVYRCNHLNDPNTWKRIWNRKTSHWSGIIHEEIINGMDGGVIFRMQDTPKVVIADDFKAECLRQMKALSYNAMYYKLLHKPQLLGGTNKGWLDFVLGARESIEDFVDKNKDLLIACNDGNKDLFFKLVEQRMRHGQPASGVNFNPQGTEPTC